MLLGEGQTFAGYTVVRRLGAGGMGEVYLAQHPRLPRQDALKLLTGDVSADPSFRERFLREADLAATLWHPHIVGVHDRGEHDGQLWISMDFVDGEDAASLLARKYPYGMPQELAVAIITAVGSALDYAHKKALLHRDVKPSNILLTHVEDGGEQRILLTDFGIARTVDDNSGLTATNVTVGTVDYAAPEQLMGEGLDGRADQYSLAATAYHLLTGTPPFRDSNAAVVIGRHLNTEPPALADTRPELAPLDHALAAALAKRPDDRFATCSDFARALSERGASAPAAPTTAAPINRPPRSAQPQPPSPLAPGWYPDPSGRAGTLYWDGRGWHTAPLPRAGPPPIVATTVDTGGSRRGVVLVVASIAVATLLIIGALIFAGSQNSGPADTATSTSHAPTEPTFPTTAAAPPLTSATSRPTFAPPQPPPPPPPPELYWDATIVGTCDEGGSCSVKQRTQPYTDAPRLHPTDLKDGSTVRVVCQTTGDLRSSDGHGASYVWYRLVNGAYVNVVYTTLKAPIGMPTC
jgi:serine/threonine protein kinase, bacterial